MTTLLFTHPMCLEHDTGPHHPECADRLKSILRALEAEEFAGLQRRYAPHATMEQLLRAHPMHHIEYVMNAIPHGDHVHHLECDHDTVVSRNSGEAALYSAGAGCAAVDAVARGDCKNAFAAVRPPGHHAERDHAMGFCLFNNAAVAAYHARAVHGLNRVAVIDIDVHHGNGTQHIFWDDAGMFYASTHELGSWPETGHELETGSDYNIANCPLPTGAGSSAFRSALKRLLLPKIRDWKPDLIIISAGFDAHVDDPMANLTLTTEDYGWATEAILGVADEVCGGRVVSILEGGYNVVALTDCVVTHVQALMQSSAAPKEAAAE